MLVLLLLLLLLSLPVSVDTVVVVVADFPQKTFHPKSKHVDLRARMINIVHLCTIYIYIHIYVYKYISYLEKGGQVVAV